MTLIDSTNHALSRKEIERQIIRKRHWYAKTKWVAMGVDADGEWIEVFHSSKRRHEAFRMLSKLVEEKLKCEVIVLERY